MSANWYCTCKVENVPHIHMPLLSGIKMEMRQE